MSWIYIGIIAGSIITSGHDTKEACLGRKAMLEEQHAVGKCVEAPTTTGFVTTYSNNILTYPH